MGFAAAVQRRHTLRKISAVVALGVAVGLAQSSSAATASRMLAKPSPEPAAAPSSWLTGVPEDVLTQEAAPVAARPVSTRRQPTAVAPPVVTVKAISPATNTCEPVQQGGIRLMTWQAVAHARSLTLSVVPSRFRGSVAVLVNDQELAVFQDAEGLSPTDTAPADRLPRAFCRAWATARAVETAWRNGGLRRPARVSAVQVAGLPAAEVRLGGTSLMTLTRHDLPHTHQDPTVIARAAADTLAGLPTPPAVVARVPRQVRVVSRPAPSPAAVAQVASSPSRRRPAHAVAAIRPNATQKPSRAVAMAGRGGRGFVGTASYYADSLHGRKTADGSRYNRNALTAAHPSLPFGTRLRVTNLKTGRVCVVVVNDRGPYAGGRSLDLSRAAAQSLGIVKQGVGRVSVEVI